MPQAAAIDSTRPAAPNPRPNVSDDGAVVTRFLSAMAAGDIDGAIDCFADDLWLRVLLPKKTLEFNDAAGAAERFRFWFQKTPLELAVEATDQHAVGSRTFVRYRFRMRPDWDAERAYRVEQSGYARATDGRLSRLDLVCTGFHPIDD